MLTADRIRHQVVFTLKPDADEADFLKAIAALESIPGVEAFELMREVSPKNGYEHALTMEFADEAAYTAYNEHPEHAGFVANRWDAEVAEFLEIDTVAR
jgi:heme-degrading monooxygenase HmoA